MWSTAVHVPLTVPLGSAGAVLEPYGGSLSGWIGTGGATVTLPTLAGGYLVGPGAPEPTVPTAPTGVIATAGDASATVQWSAPADNGGSEVTSYVVRSFVPPATEPTRTDTIGAGETTLLIAGLTNGTTYAFDVAAVNDVGTGPTSELSAPVTPQATIVPAPSGVVAQAGNASATVTWVAPTDTVGITGYRVRAFQGQAPTEVQSVTVAADRGSASVTGLVNGIEHVFDVTAVYGSSYGPPSDRSAGITPTLASQADGAPSIVSLVAGSQSVAVSWLPPVDLGAGSASGYRMRTFTSPDSTAVVREVTAAGSASTTTVTGLTNGTTYFFEVTVLYPEGAGPTSARSAGVIPVATVPSAPGIGKAVSGKVGGVITATAKWSAPTSTGGSAITGYVVTAWKVVDGVATFGQVADVGAKTKSYVMTFTVPGIYYFTVVARNAVGDSPPSAASNTVNAR